MSGYQVLIAYPRKDGASFNKDYYVSTHMPLVKKHWEKHGLKSYAVSELNADSPYSLVVVMHFESAEGFAAAGADPDVKVIRDDVANFSTIPPVLLHGPVIGSG